MDVIWQYDLIARVQADDEYDLTRCIVEDIRPMQGIVETKTLIGAELSKFAREFPTKFSRNTTTACITELHQ